MKSEYIKSDIFLFICFLFFFILIYHYHYHFLIIFQQILDGHSLVGLAGNTSQSPYILCVCVCVCIYIYMCVCVCVCVTLCIDIILGGHSILFLLIN